MAQAPIVPPGQEKYKKKNNHYAQAVSEKPKDRINIEIGDAKQPDFKPQFKIMRWDNEVNFSIRAEEHPAATVDFEDGKIKYKTPKYEVHQYDKPEASENGGYEFEWVLTQKPQSNILTATIQTKGLKFYYQPALTQQEIDDGAVRPDNVIGSYAVYHESKGGINYEGGMEYKVGKAFHIYRPKVTDANNNQIWGELNIDVENGLLTVTVDQGFLDDAVYPVVVDPTFGYTAVGQTAGFALYANVTSDTSSTNGQAYPLTFAANLVSIKIATRVNTGTVDASLFGALYREDSADTDSHDLVVGAEVLDIPHSTTYSFKTINFNNESLVIDDYIIAGLGDGEEMGVSQQIQGCFDTTTARNNYFESTTGAGSYAARKAENPWTEVDSSSTSQISIYAVLAGPFYPGRLPVKPR